MSKSIKKRQVPFKLYVHYPEENDLQTLREISYGLYYAGLIKLEGGKGSIGNFVGGKNIPDCQSEKQ